MRQSRSSDRCMGMEGGVLNVVMHAHAGCGEHPGVATILLVVKQFVAVVSRVLVHRRQQPPPHSGEGVDNGVGVVLENEQPGRGQTENGQETNQCQGESQRADVCRQESMSCSTSNRYRAIVSLDQ